MDNRPADSVSHDLDALFRLGVVAAMSDEQLLERFAAQIESDSEIAFEAIVRRHGPMVMGVCRRLLGNEHDAEDAFQATFLILARRAASIGRRDRLANWLYGVAVRTSKEARRRAARQHARERRLMNASNVEVENAPGEYKDDILSAFDEEVIKATRA